LRQNNLGAPSSQAQINQIDTFSTYVINATEQSSMGKFVSSLPNIKNSWIIDFGAIDHVCTDLSAFTTYTNGQSVFVIYSGSVKFSTKFYLSNVLYVP